MAHPFSGTGLAAAALAAAIAFAPGAAGAQTATSLNFSGVPLSPSLFDRSAPAPLLPEPGGPFSVPAVTMPVPPLARATLPALGGASDPDAQAAEAPEAETDDHPALDDRALESVH